MGTAWFPAPIKLITLMGCMHQPSYSHVLLQLYDVRQHK